MAATSAEPVSNKQFYSVRPAVNEPCGSPVRGHEVFTPGLTGIGERTSPARR